MSVNSKMTALADEVRALNGTEGKISIDQMTELVDLANEEVVDQSDLLDQAIRALQGKAAGGSGGDSGLPAGYSRVDYIQFSGKQVVDTGVICNQNTKLHANFTRDASTQEYLYGVASSGNTASVTAYLGGSWRFGNKAVTKSVTTVNDKIGYGALVDKSQISISGSISSISGVNEFETVGSLLLGSCRSASGAVGAAQFDGKIFFFNMWQGEEPVLKLKPVVSADGVYRFYDTVSGEFFDSITDTPLDGGNL